MHQQLDYEITHSYSGLNISEAETKRLIDIATWNGKVPTFNRPGRVAWHALEEDVTLKADPSIHFKAAKLKGVGLWNPASDEAKFTNTLHKDGFTTQAVPPLTDMLEYLVTYPHMGIGNDGEYMFAYSKPSPVGGIVHDRAHLEFWSGEKLMEHGVSSIAPLAVIEYKDLKFNEQPMGAAISLAPGAASFRISEILFGAAMSRGSDPGFDQHYDDIREKMGIDGDPDDERVRLQVISELARQAGSLMRQFAMAGMYRYSGDWGNFVYSVERGELFLIDLDSVQDMQNLPEPVRAMQAWRDLSSSVYRMLAKLGYPTALDRYTLKNLLEFDPVTEFLSGYFVDIPKAELSAIASKLWGYFVPHLFLLKKHTEAIQKEWDGDRRKSYKMDHDLFNVLALTLLQPLFARSEVGKKYPNDVTQQEMCAKAERFLGERYEYFEYLLAK